jgi:hypothetical protein
MVTDNPFVGIDHPAKRRVLLQECGELFADFPTALYSLFVVMTGDGWSSNIAQASICYAACHGQRATGSRQGM